MEQPHRILVLIVCSISVITALTGKGYFCRDPDTGFLHPANSTWSSISFCGNYSCKLKRKTIYENKTPLREINITNINITRVTPVNGNERVESNDDTNDMHSAGSSIKPVLSRVSSPELDILKNLLPTSLQNDLTSLNIHERLKHDQKIPENGDRYLTDNEIKTISDLLHTVKKSDLEAIVDIYNLAQDIYKEMDKMTTENILENHIKAANVLQDKSDQTRVSYWYEPAYRLNKEEVKVDLVHQGSDAMSTSEPPVEVNPTSYFQGPLMKADFGKLPYYYPMSSFQRQSSYRHPAYVSQLDISTPKPPCFNQLNNPALPAPVPYYPPLPVENLFNSPQNFGGVIKKPFTVETQKQIQNTNLLPYPFSFVQHNNMSTYPLNMYYDLNPWARFEINNNNQKSFYKSHLDQLQNNDISDNKKETNIQPEPQQKEIESSNLLDSLLASAKVISKKPEWQTDPLSSFVLDEVRANFEEKTKLLKPLSLRKKVKLERVGKLVKLDEIHREKRNIDAKEKPSKDDDSEEMEVYIEKTTCVSDVDPGYFRMGNLSEPFPACCPQRINNDSNQ